MRPALHPLLQLDALAQRVVQAGAQIGKAATLGRVQQRRAQRLPVAVQRHQVVERDLRLGQQRGRRVDQRFGPHPGVAQRHGGLQALLGDAVHPAVMLAKFTLGLAQRVLTLQRLHRRQLDLQQRRGDGGLQQRGVVAQRGLQARLPLRQRVVTLAGLGVGLGLRRPGGLLRCLLGRLLGRLLRRCGRFLRGGRRRRPFGRRRSAAFLEKPTQHGIAVRAAGRVNASGGARQTPTRAAV